MDACYARHIVYCLRRDALILMRAPLPPPPFFLICHDVYAAAADSITARLSEY